jgi:uncharacterized protein (TIGR02757 family)
LINHFKEFHGHISRQMNDELRGTVLCLLEEKANMYNRFEFIRDDPIKIPHQFTKRENIEISGLLAATLAWGQREVIIRNAMDLMARMDNDPFDFLMNMEERDLDAFRGFRHRTFNAEDCRSFMKSLRRIYRQEGGLYEVFLTGYLKDGNMREAIGTFRRIFTREGFDGRSLKHVADPFAGSSAKRINMFLRWMVRRDGAGVDFGIWKKIDPAHLFLPLDLHTGHVARKLGILQRKQNDWKAVEELTGVLREFDPADPVKYDFALFGLGIFESF